MVPLIEPPPVSILGVPVPDIVFVLDSQIAAVLVPLVAAPGSEFTVNVLADEVDPQEPLADMV